MPLGLFLVLLVAACAPAGPAAPPRSTGGAATASQARKVLAAGIFSAPAGMQQELTNPQGASGSVPGLAELYQLLDADLTYFDQAYTRYPWLVAEVPSVDNGLWQVFPDGTMETTWRLKPGLTWHDGVPLTASDLAFTLAVYRNKDLGLAPVRALPFIDAVDTPDDQTVALHWQQPYISADALFSAGVTGMFSSMWLLPQHLLEAPIQQDPSKFLGLPYWREEFVGAGPYKMQSWIEGTSVTLAANDSYALGRPRIDQIDIHFYTDRNAVIAGLLSGALDVHLGRGLFPEDVLQIQSSTQNVRVQLSGPLGNLLPVYGQSMNPDPPIVANPQFRRALLMAIDRQAMTDSLNYGLGPVADSWVPPDQPEGKAVDGQLVRYPYDPRAATQQLQDLGYAKGTDGSFRDAAGVLLAVQIATHTQNSFHEPATLAVARYWKDLGLNAEPDVRSAEAAADLKWRAEYPGFFLVSRGLAIDQPDGYFTQQAIPTAQNNYRGGNTARAGSAELDALIKRYIATVPVGDRMATLGQIVHTQTEQVMMMPLFFQGPAFVLGNVRLQNVLAGQVWNAQLWDLG
ncbi:MAG: peptide/nickel transport system substrate-binding protein [Chloroflexota bacterium]|nr:peptide/nickel transport system substrate-binding protein [Chloroflexota bacterium]